MHRVRMPAPQFMTCLSGITTIQMMKSNDVIAACRRQKAVMRFNLWRVR
jgi:hypothetical protein